MRSDQFKTTGIIAVIIAIIFNSCLNETLYAQKKTNQKSNNISGEFSLRSFYDNNALKYSDKYLDRFINNQDPGRFHINTYDDLVMDYSAKLSYSADLIKSQRSIFSISVDYNQYTSNSIKSWLLYDFGWQQSITEQTSLMLSYSYLPDFYISHFRDDDWTEIYGFTSESFQPYSFSKSDFDLWIQHIFSSSIKSRLYFSFSKYFYNKHFIEYDSDNFMLGAKIFAGITNKLGFDAGYKWNFSDALGFDGYNETKNNSDDNDATYYEHIFALGIDYSLPDVFKLNNSISFSAELGLRYYTTDKTADADPLHAGRGDINYRLNTTYKIDIHKNISTGLFASYIFRNADTDIDQNEVFVSDEKDYSQFQIGLNFNYKFRL
jgi:hypothetical protein